MHENRQLQCNQPININNLIAGPTNNENVPPPMCARPIQQHVTLLCAAFNPCFAVFCWLLACCRRHSKVTSIIRSPIISHPFLIQLTPPVMHKPTTHTAPNFLTVHWKMRLWFLLFRERRALDEEEIGQDLYHLSLIHI